MRIDIHCKKNNQNNILRNFYMPELPCIGEVLLIKDKQHSTAHEGQVTLVERHIFREASGTCTVTAHIFIDENYHKDKSHG